MLISFPLYRLLPNFSPLNFSSAKEFLPVISRKKNMAAGNKYVHPHERQFLFSRKKMRRRIFTNKKLRSPKKIKV